jgi:hypothetical protein
MAFWGLKMPGEGIFQLSVISHQLSVFGQSAIVKEGEELPITNYQLPIMRFGYEA